jgi:hypothetical protein
MNGQADGNREVLPVAERERIDRECQQFRAAWQAGQHPRIEDFLGDASDAARTELLGRLLADALACRSRSGEMPAPDEYEQRFPADAATVRQAFSQSRILHRTDRNTARVPSREPGWRKRRHSCGQDPASG